VNKLAAEDAFEYAEQVLSLKFSAEHRRFLAANESCDVHACPGSGKTTLLVAKLAILSRDWDHRDHGLLVLSHTNVARAEVEKRLCRGGVGSRLLRYPHFVGTIQGFVDRFLALPYLRDTRGASFVPVVDDERFACAAKWKYEHRSTKYSRAAGWLEHARDPEAVLATLHYVGTANAVASDARRIPDANKPSYKELKAFKDSLTEKGFFRFADMFAFAAAALQERPWLREAVVTRFPWVFVDETQDTRREVLDLIDSIFLGRSIVQRLGDANQAIYQDTGAEAPEGEFAWRCVHSLPRSFRLQPKVAAFASRLTVAYPQTIVGNPERVDHSHTVFVFDNDTIHGVLPAFAEVLVREWPAGFPQDFVAKAVGFRKSESGSAHLPRCIGDYWYGFDPGLDQGSVPRDSFIHAVRWARRAAASTGEFGPPFDALAAVLASVARDANGGRMSQSQVMHALRSGGHAEHGLRRVLRDLIEDRLDLTERFWADVTQEVQAQARLASFGMSEGRPEFFAWDASSPTPRSGQGARSPGNVARILVGARVVPITVTTIHSVKGETHHATLVLETIMHEHDMRFVVPILLGDAVERDFSNAQLNRVRRLFVGMTRPSDLLCLAVHRDGVDDEQLRRLAATGWMIQRVATCAGAVPMGA
jgi:hypothetical protein